MTRPSAYLILPTAEHAAKDKDAAQETALLLTQCLEDLRLAEHVQRALRATRYESLRDTAVTVHQRLVILEGRVPNYYLKQIAQTTALAVPGVHEVRNNLKVRRASRHDEGYAI
jgi:osmotically-inducible protein OsmY